MGGPVGGEQVPAFVRGHGRPYSFATGMTEICVTDWCQTCSDIDYLCQWEGSEAEDKSDREVTGLPWHTRKRLLRHPVYVKAYEFSNQYEAGDGTLL